MPKAATTTAKPAAAKTAAKPISAAAAKAAKATKASPSKAAKPAKAKKPAAEPAYNIGDVVSFAGYAGEVSEPYLTPGEDVVIVNIIDSDAGKLFHVVKVEDKSAYDENPDDEDLTIDELSIAEIKRRRGRQKTLEPVKETEVRAIGKFSDLVDEDDPLESAKELFNAVNENFFYLGGALSLIYHKKKFVTQYGFTDDKEGWAKFLDENFGFKEGKARGLIDIYQSFSLANADVERISKIGWSKAAEIARYVTEGNSEELLDAGENMSILDLKEHIKTTYVSEGITTGGRAIRGNRIKKIKFTFDLLEDSAESVKLIFEMAEKSLGVDRNSVLEHIVTEWGNEHLDPAQAKKAEAARNKKIKELRKAGVDIPERAAASASEIAG